MFVLFKKKMSFRILVIFKTIIISFRFNTINIFQIICRLLRKIKLIQLKGINNFADGT